MTYTIYRDLTGEPIARGLSIEDAARERLMHGSNRYEMHRDQMGVWTLMTARGQSALGETWTGDRLIVSTAETEEEAFADMASAIAFADWPHNGASIMSDADFEAMQAEDETA